MSVTLDDIRNLSAEVNSLVQAGLPLEANLAEAGSGHSAKLEKLTAAISADLQGGKSLEETIKEQSVGAPRMLAAAVAAGVRTGRLGQSVEMLGDMANDLIELRRRILQSISYPLTVVAVGLLMFSIFIRAFLQRVDLMLNDHSMSSPALQSFISWDREYWWWPMVLPLAGIAAIAFWVISGRAASMAFRGPERLLFMLPGVPGMIRDLQFYSLSRMFSLMIERQLPLPEALELAGASCGNKGLDTACRNAAQNVQQGRLPAAPEKNWNAGELPPLLAATLRQASVPVEEFQQRLRGITGYYRRRLNVSILWLRNIVPIAMFIIIGGGSVVLYALSVFWPVAEIYQNISPN